MRENYECYTLKLISEDIQIGCSREELLKHREKLRRMNNDFINEDDYFTKIKLLKIIKEFLEESK